MRALCRADEADAAIAHSEQLLPISAPDWAPSNVPLPNLPSFSLPMAMPMPMPMPSGCRLIMHIQSMPTPFSPDAGACRALHCCKYLTFWRQTLITLPVIAGGADDKETGTLSDASAHVNMLATLPVAADSGRLSANRPAIVADSRKQSQTVSISANQPTILSEPASIFTPAHQHSRLSLPAIQPTVFADPAQQHSHASSSGNQPANAAEPAHSVTPSEHEIHAAQVRLCLCAPH